MDKVEGNVPCTLVSVVLETLPDDQNVRAALLIPHIARKLVKESVDSDGNGILSTLTDSILVDLPFRNLLYESRKVQRLYYELDGKDEILYGKSKKVTNSLLLIDPIRLLNLLQLDMNQAQRSLFMRCFTPRIWLIFLRLVSLGVGSKIRELYSLKWNKVVSDHFLMDLENFQLSLVKMLIELNRCKPTVSSPSEIQSTILRGCRNIYLLSEKLNQTWSSCIQDLPLLNELIPYLNKCVSHFNELLSKNSLNSDKILHKYETELPPSEHEPSSHCKTTFCSTGSRGFRSLEFLDNSNEDEFSLTEVCNSFKLETNTKTPFDSGSLSEKLDLEDDPELIRVLQDLRNAIISVSTKSATLLSLMKLKILEQRQKEFETPGSFSFISNEILRKGFNGCTLDENEAVPLIILTHCLGAYSIREWVIRFLVDVKLDKISEFLNQNSDLSVNSYGFKESPYFRTAGQTSPEIGDYFTLIPPEVKFYMKRLSAHSR